MPFTKDDTTLYRRDVASKGQYLAAEERERLLEPYLPKPQTISSTNGTTQTSRLKHRPRIRAYLKSKLHLLLYLLIQLVFGIYIRIRQIYHATFDRILAILHYHHRTPEYIRNDVKTLSRLPEHLSVILKYRVEEDGALELLMDEVAELCAWSAAAGIPILSVYEKSGILKTYREALQEIVKSKLTSYFGSGTATPKLRMFTPNHASRSPSPRITPLSEDSGSIQSLPTQKHLTLILLSATDGRDTIVDLTRTLTEMAQSQKLGLSDITADLVNAEIMVTTSPPQITSGSLQPQMTVRTHNNQRQSQKEVAEGEPDLLIIFGPYVKLDGYPPWQIRLTEIFCVGDSGGDVRRSGSTRVEYQAFLRALWSFAGAEMRFGR